MLSFSINLFAFLGSLMAEAIVLLMNAKSMNEISVGNQSRFYPEFYFINYAIAG
jgi:hypothetical protein